MTINLPQGFWPIRVETVRKAFTTYDALERWKGR